jgi:hypothetical protein
MQFDLELLKAIAGKKRYGGANSLKIKNAPERGVIQK